MARVAWRALARVDRGPGGAMRDRLQPRTIEDPDGQSGEIRQTVGQPREDECAEPVQKRPTIVLLILWWCGPHRRMMQTRLWQIGPNQGEGREEARAAAESYQPCATHPQFARLLNLDG
jgi:hypothetical protein